MRKLKDKESFYWKIRLEFDKHIIKLKCFLVQPKDLLQLNPLTVTLWNLCYYSFGCLTWCWQLNGRSYCPFFEWQYVRLSVVFVHLGNEFMFAYPKCFLIRCSRNRRNLVLQRRNGNWEMKKCSLNRSVFLSGVRVSGVDCNEYMWPLTSK